jgi:hypothetical protein
MYLGNWHQEAHGSRSPWAKSLWDPISTNGWVQWYSPVIPCYTRGWDQEDHSSSPAKAKKVMRPNLNRKKPAVMGMYICHPSYSRKPKMKEWTPGNKWDLISKITTAKKGLEAWLKTETLSLNSSTVPLKKFFFHNNTGSVGQEVIIINIYAPNNRTSKCKNKTW